MLNALRRGLISPVPPESTEQTALGDLWRLLLRDPETQDAARRVAMQASAIDIQLLLGDLIAASR